MPPRLHELQVENFRSLRDVTLHLGPLNVLVGPNGAGKTNVIEAIRLLGQIAAVDLTTALMDQWPGILFRAKDNPPSGMSIRMSGVWHSLSHREIDDSFSLDVVGNGPLWRRTERLTYATGEYPLISTLDDTTLTASSSVITDGKLETDPTMRVDPRTSLLSTLPRLSPEFGSEEAAALAILLREARFIHADTGHGSDFVGRSRYDPGAAVRLSSEADNLAAFLLMLSQSHEDNFEQLEADAKAVLPQLEKIDFDFPSGAGREVVIVLRERGLSGATQLADASLGTIRLLGLLAALYDPDPPALTCIEEIELGLHPQALERLVHRLREAGERTQFLITTHSPSVVDRLRPEEMIICERRADGSSAIPAVSTERVREIVGASENLPLGELWFSGVLGGDL